MAGHKLKWRNRCTLKIPQMMRLIQLQLATSYACGDGSGM